MKLVSLTICAFLSLSCADFDKNVDDVIKVAQKNLPPTQRESVMAAKQALEQGVMTGTNMLQKPGGFFQSSYKIPIPSELQSTTKLARQVGLGSYIDDFERSLNRAAEQAVSAATPIFNDAIKQLSFQDIVDILQGADNAATNYFRRTSESKLEEAFMPIISEATKKNDVAKIYSQIVRSIRPAALAAGVQIPDINLNDYVTSQAIDALFSEIAVQEKKIRENPQEQTSQLLKKVFSYYEDQSPQT
ncbi:MAG: DUF4197 domain-containing protein [Oligoflexus sp.]